MEKFIFILIFAATYLRKILKKDIEKSFAL